MGTQSAKRSRREIVIVVTKAISDEDQVVTAGSSSARYKVGSRANIGAAQEAARGNYGGTGKKCRYD